MAPPDHGTDPLADLFPSLTWQEQVSRAEALLAGGDPAEAEAAYRAAMDEAPEDLTPYVGASKCARARGDHAASLAAFDAAAAVQPAHEGVQMERATDLRALGRTDEAEQAYRRILAAAPDNVGAHLSLGHCARARGDDQAALAAYRAAAAAAPENPWPVVEIAATHQALGQVDEAEMAYAGLTVLGPQLAQGWLGLAQAARRHGNRVIAFALFQAAARAEPDNPWPLLEAAADLRALGRVAEAQARYLQALVLAPENPQAHQGLAQCARHLGEPEAALGHFQAAIDAAPADPWPRLELAVQQRESGDIEAARQTALTVLAQHPGHLHALLSLGLSERSAGRRDAALAAFTAAHEAHPGAAEPLVDMALEARDAGDQGACDAHLAQALACDPGNVAAIVCAAEQAAMAADMETAHDIYRRAVLANPDQVAFQVGLADTLAARGDLAAALASLDAFEAAHRPLPATQAKRIFILRQAGETARALHLAREASAAPQAEFGIWVERFLCEILGGTDGDVADCLASMQPATVMQRALLHRFAGNFAERGWRLDEACRHYEEAAVLCPHDAGIQFELVRARLLSLDVAGARLNLRRFCALNAPITRLQRKSLNISQSHYGQIIDEYSLDAEALAQLTALQAVPPTERVPGLRDMVRQHPDNTAAAVALMVALRQSGAFDQACAPGGRAIPQNLIQFWDSPDVPADVAAIMESWRLTNPHLPCRLFHDAAARAFLAQRFPPAVLAAYTRVRVPAQKADIFRLAWLAAEGGMYADADDRCLSPIVTIMPAHAELVLYQEDHATLGNNFVGTIAGHPVMRRALQLAVGAINRGDTDNIWLATGPGLLTRAFAQIVADPAADTSRIAVLDRRVLFRAVAIHCAAGYKRTDRHWSNTAFARRRQGDAAEKTPLAMRA